MEKIEDYIDISLWKKQLEIFSSSINTVVLTIDNKGKEVAKTKDFPFLCKIIHSKDKQTCTNCWLENMNSNNTTFTCPAGLTNIMAPIMINDKKVGAIICSGIKQSTTQTHSNSTPYSQQATLMELSSMINIDFDELHDAFISIPLTEEIKIKEYRLLLSKLSQSIPDLLYQKKHSDRRIEELRLLNNVNSIINNTSGLSESFSNIKKKIKMISFIEECSIVLFSNENIETGDKGNESTQTIENIVSQEIKNTNNVVKIKDIKNHPRFKQINIKYMPYDLVAVPLNIADKMIGCVIYYFFSLDKVNEEDIRFLSTLTDHISIVIINAQNIESIKSKAVTDKLTGLFNRELFMNMIENDLVKRVEMTNPLSLAMIDIDDFKHYNDTHGHVKGDELLKQMSSILQKNTRSSDIVGRYGGEEFIIISPGTNSNIALDVMERIRKVIEDNDFFGKEDQPMGKVTVSVGLITCMDKSILGTQLIKEADKSLYRAKADGKNKVKSIVIVDKGLSPVDVQEANRS
ncbi:MAG: diguanylate cyclase [Candidatus Woesearchaeota archaeon]